MNSRGLSDFRNILKFSLKIPSAMCDYDRYSKPLKAQGHAHAFRQSIKNQNGQKKKIITVSYSCWKNVFDL